ncbi:MAG: alpha/beta hydrolase [Pseudomonadota bacterium]
MSELARVTTSVLDIAYEHSGPEHGALAVLLHGYPYDVRSFDEVVRRLNGQGMRTIVPYLRGYGGTRFLRSDTPRSGEQAALAHDLLEFMDQLQISQALLGGFDWGGRAACIAAALWPERVIGLVGGGGYLIQNNDNAAKPLNLAQEQAYWYQYYFHSARGRRCLEDNRHALGAHIWRLWSPDFAFSDATYNATAKSFDNADFVDVVLHSYCHRTGSADGDPRYAETERLLRSQPKIGVPTITLHGASDGVTPVSLSQNEERFFTGQYEKRVLTSVGHNIPMEAPEQFAQAVLDLAP